MTESPPRPLSAREQLKARFAKHREAEHGCSLSADKDRSARNPEGREITPLRAQTRPDRERE
jgi:hypothetical protein